MVLAIIILLLILVPTLVAALLFAVAWMLKYNPGLLTEFQHLIVPCSIAGGIIMLIPLLIGLVIAIINLWGKIQQHKSKD